VYDWPAAEAHISVLFEHHGPLSSDDPDWSCQADVERAIQVFFLNAIRKEPSTAAARTYAKEFIEKFNGH
jgi:hypothetical protein